MKRVYFCLLFFILALLFFFNINNKKSDYLTFSSWGSQSETVILQELINEFEKNNPDIRIKFIHVPQNYFQKIQLLFASNLEPDVIFFNNQNIQMYIKAGLLEDLTPYIDKKDFFEEALNCFSYNGKIYAIPRDISTLVIYYNKSIFKPNKPFKNIYELRDEAIRHTNKNHFGINFEEDSLFWVYYLASNGGGIISDDKSQIIINSEKSKEAINLYSDLINKYNAIPSKSQIGSMTTAQMFINGKLAMYLGGRWMVPKFRQVLDFDWDIIEFPSTKNNKLYLDSSGWAVSKKSANKEKALKFVKYLSNKTSIDKMAQTGLIIPARIDCAYDLISLDKNKKPKNSIIFISMIKNTKPTPANENYPAINDIIKEKMQILFSDNTKSKDVFNDRTIKQLESLL